jgi:hypothetical protein
MKLVVSTSWLTMSDLLVSLEMTLQLVVLALLNGRGVAADMLQPEGALGPACRVVCLRVIGTLNDCEAGIPAFEWSAKGSEINGRWSRIAGDLSKAGHGRLLRGDAFSRPKAMAWSLRPRFPKRVSVR